MGALVPVRVDNRLRIVASSVPPECIERLKQASTFEDPTYDRMARLAKGNKKLRWKLKTMQPITTTWALAADGELSLPRGATTRVRSVLAEFDLTPRFDDARILGNGPRFPRSPVHRPDPRSADGGELRWYQRCAVDAGLERQNCLLRAPTGSGKTTSAIALAVEADVPALIVVWSKGLFGQWEDRLQRELGLRPHEIGRIAGGERSVRPITIAMQQTLWRRTSPDFVRLWGAVICDEVQRAAAKTFIDVFDRFPAKYRIGISADESRSDGKEFLVYELFGEVAHEVSQDDLIAEGAVLDVECRVIPTEFRADWYVQQRRAGFSPDFNKLLDEIQKDEARNALVLDVVAEEARAGEQVLVLSHRVEHVQRFDAGVSALGIPCDVMLGGDEWKSRFDATKDGLQSGRLRVACGTIQAVGTGIDIPTLGRGVLTTPIGSNRQLYGQVRGRFCRPGKKDAVIYVLWDQHVSGEYALKNLMKWNRSVVVRADDGSWLSARDYLGRL